jgi:hypothetical protein
MCCRACRARSSRSRARADGERTNDPRRSIAERYRDREQYLGLISKAANELVERGYLLKEDVSRIVEQTATRWDHLTAATR